MTAMSTELDALRELAGTGFQVEIHVRADLAHIMAHTGIDEPSGTWTGGDCPHYGREIGSDVDLADLGVIHRGAPGGLADWRWYPGIEASAVCTRLNKEAMADAQRWPHEHELDWWQHQISACWSYLWAANADFLQDAQEPARRAGGQGYVIASFEHNSSDHHGLQRPHVHNLVPMRK